MNVISVLLVRIPGFPAKHQLRTPQADDVMRSMVVPSPTWLQRHEA